MNETFRSTIFLADDKKMDSPGVDLKGNLIEDDNLLH